MKDNKFKDLLNIARKIGGKPEYFQGGGGNISVKFRDSNEMRIKASGYRISDMSIDSGFVSVNCVLLKNFFKKVSKKSGDYEKESLELTTKSILSLDKSKKPSIETGFHTLLGDFVIHSHSVYANILSCSKDFDNLAKELFGKIKSTVDVIDYAAPGYHLTLNVNKVVKNNHSEDRIIFMKNHGVIVSASSASKAVALHEKVSKIIKSHFKIKTSYPIPKIKKISENHFVSNSKFLLNFLKTHNNYFLKIKSHLLFPDLVVFCNNTSNKKGKIKVDTKNNSIIYLTNEKEARTIEENLLSWAYILSNLEKNNLKPNFLTKKDADFILNMDSEKYRKKLLK